MIVADASVIVKWINKDEPDSDKAFFLYKNHIEKEEEIIVPQLLLIEVANFLATKSSTSEENVKKSLLFLYESNLIIWKVTQELLIEASLLAKKYKTSVYDMLYAVIAKQNNTILVTSDAKFINKTKFTFVKLLDSLK